MTIGALSARSGVHVETIRYYERAGLLPAPPRSPGGHRLYGAEHRRRLAFVRRARELGFALEEIRGLLGLVGREGRGGACGEVRAMTLDHLGRVRAKIADLRRMERLLAAAAARCAEEDGGEAPDCPILDALDGEG